MIGKNRTNKATSAGKGFLVAVATSCAVLGSSVNAMAEGYQINSQSTKQVGMGHTGVALKLGAESMLFNPAGMSFMENKFDVSLGITGIKSKVEYSNGSYSAKTDNPMGTPIFGYFGYKPTKNLAVGVSITNPVGNSMHWPSNWAGATLIQEINLKGYSVQPTVSYKLCDRISLGAGLMIDFGNFDLSRALVPVGGLDGIGTAFPALQPAIESFAGEVPVSAKLKGSTKIRLGINVGVLVDISDKVSFGVSYRSKVRFTADKGNAELIYANENAKTVINTVNGVRPGTVPIPPLEAGTFEASLPAPSNVNVGVAYKPIKDLTLTAELQFVGWEAYDSLTIQFDQNVLNGYSIRAEKNYKNTVIYRIGGEYNVSDFATVRLGAYYDTTPVRKNLYNPETPGSNKLAITAGASLRPLPYMSIDLAFAYINGAKTYGSYPFPTATNPDNVFAGDYKASAFMPSIGLSFKF